MVSSCPTCRLVLTSRVEKKVRWSSGRPRGTSPHFNGQKRKGSIPGILSRYTPRFHPAPPPQREDGSMLWMPAIHLAATHPSCPAQRLALLTRSLVSSAVAEEGEGISTPVPSAAGKYRSTAPAAHLTRRSQRTRTYLQTRASPQTTVEVVRAHSRGRGSHSYRNQASRRVAFASRLGRGSHGSRCAGRRSPPRRQQSRLAAASCASSCRSAC